MVASIEDKNECIFGPLGIIGTQYYFSHLRLILQMSGNTSAGNWTSKSLIRYSLHLPDGIFLFSLWMRALKQLVRSDFFYLLTAVFFSSHLLHALTSPWLLLFIQICTQWVTAGMNNKNKHWKWLHSFEYWDSWPHVQCFRN